MKSHVFIIIAVMCVSCGLGQMDVGVHSGADGIWRGPSYGKHMTGTVYAVGVEYPDGYDWRVDPENGKVRTALVLFADGIPVLKVPVGPEYEISSDEASHRIRDGYLYTDHTDGNTTVIKKDGLEIVRYEGAEEVLCLEVFDGMVHLLTTPVGGTGFRYRVDGILVLDKPEGSPFLHMSESADSVRFFFSQSQRTSSGTEQRYYQVSDGTIRKMDVDTSVAKVWDMRMTDDGVSLVGSLTDGTLVLVSGEGVDHMQIGLSQEVVSCAFCYSDRLGVCVRIRYAGDNLMTDVIWSGIGEQKMYRIGRTLSAVYIDDEGCNAVMNPSDGRDGIIFRGSSANLMPAGYSVYSKDCMTCRDSMLYVALSSAGKGYPVLWRNGSLDTLKMNGPLTCLQ